MLYLTWITKSQNLGPEKIQYNFLRYKAFEFNLNRATHSSYFPIIIYLNLNTLNYR